jgi:hypothetical protein
MVIDVNLIDINSAITQHNRMQNLKVSMQQFYTYVAFIPLWEMTKKNLYSRTNYSCNVTTESLSLSLSLTGTFSIQFGGKKNMEVAITVLDL